MDSTDQSPVGHVEPQIQSHIEIIKPRKKPGCLHFSRVAITVTSVPTSTSSHRADHVLPY